MPGLPETMYCSEQITIPPAFPYLLRQYAKAAIRSQPTDLLQWSTAYFRCLSLNIPPPVKPRLEYPIPREHCGITPGWLKALLYQLSNNRFIHFKILWDRWTGACLSHETLIKMLCLGGFHDPKEIPWLRFIALCAAHLTDDLTSTMKLLCEIITEEPEGGSAMIPYEIFIDLYKFLARIDASKPQVIKNIHFSDSLLSLYKGPSEEDMEVEKDKEEAVEGSEESEKRSESIKSYAEELEKEQSKGEISCPSVIADDQYSVDSYIEQGIVDQEGEEAELTISQYLDQSSEGEEGLPIEGRMFGIMGEDDEEEGATIRDRLPLESADTILDEPRKITAYDSDDEKHLLEDLEKFKAMEQEIPGEMDDELEKYKCRLMAEMPLTDSQTVAIEAFKEKEEEKKPEEAEMEEKSAEEEEEVAPAEAALSELWVDKIPGIGPIVSEALMKAVEEYMKNVAVVQHNMVMPRNIRHYNCPPLEVVET